MLPSGRGHCRDRAGPGGAGLTATGRPGAAVLVSGRGTNLLALLTASAETSYPAEVVAVASNRPSCPALAAAVQRGVAARSFPAGQFGQDPLRRDQEMSDWLRSQGASLLVLAGYDRIVTEPLLTAFAGRILNLHNSLLPAFSGTMNAVSEALDHGVKVTGCTVHLVDSGAADGGPIVMQAAVPVREEDTEETLLARIHEKEWRILPAALALLAEGRLRVEGRRVRVLEAAS
jgi:phosphoribosylglycinamide formyltransferase-1